MKTKTIIISVFLSLVILTACHDETGYFREAEAGLEQGCQYITDKQTEAAAQSLSQALLAIDRCDPTKPEVKRLKGLIEDNLGFAYWKHELFDEALPLHTDAAHLFRDLGNDTLLMNALRNCARTAASIGDIDAAQKHYDEALQLAKKLNDETTERELLLNSSLDVLMAKEDYGQAIERVSQALAKGADADACHLTLGLAHYYLSHDSLAIVHLNEATHSDKAGVRMSAYQSLHYLYQFAGDYQKALECHELFNDNMMQADREHRGEQMQHIKADYDLQMQKNKLEAEQKLRSLYLYLILGGLVVALAVLLLLLRQKTLSAKLKAEEMKNQLELELKKNKVYVTALALTEQITASTLDFNLKENEWDDFVTLIDKVYGNFTKRLMEKYPTLTKSDLQICCLTKQGFSNQVISILMNLQTNSYARRKSRIKQEKMNGLEDERSFEEIIDSL
ncbi:MAG: tetratricopeptide repeat protein [Bacteroidales bacterium]|nr:tetratricopeptide repeat protein [Bacteroidales bacterium]